MATKGVTLSHFCSRFAGLVLGVGMLIGLVAAPVLADGVSQGYATTDTSLQPGMVVQLSKTSTATTPSVERATVEQADHIIGVVTSGTSNQLVLSTGQQEVFVQSSGDVASLVSDINGVVKKGDLLTISPLSGVLMRSSDTTTTPVIAIAQADFNVTTAKSYEITIADKGKKQSLIDSVQVNLDHKAAASGAGAAVASPDSLQRLGKAVTGDYVSELRVLIALIIFFLILVSEGGIIYGAVASAVTSLGRNPLASKIIKSELIKVFFMAFFVFGIGMATIYGVLWL